MTSRHRDNCPLDCKVYVGELGNNGTRHELEEAFGYYGPLRNVWVARNPPGFAFVMFEDSRDARDAVRALNGKTICGRRVKVELSSGKTRREMAQQRTINPRESRYSPRSGRSPRARSPRERERREYYHEPRDEREYYKTRPKKHRSRSRSRSSSPIVKGARNDGYETRVNSTRNHSRTPPSRSRSRSLSR